MEETKIIPTVGRVVYFKTTAVPVGTESPANRAAIITQVNSETNVGLAIMHLNHMQFVESVEQGEGNEQWNWMSYQLKTASIIQPVETAPEAVEAPVETVPEVQEEPTEVANPDDAPIA